MAKPKLHLDADTSITVLYKALLDRGFDVTRTPSDWMSSDACDEAQLLGATAHDRCIFTFNIRDFMVLAQKHSHHHGIILAAQKSWRLSEIIKALTRLLSETQAMDWRGQVRWLNNWRER
jgi:hypothetical protein